MLPFFFLPMMMMAQVTIGSGVIPNPGAIVDLKEDGNREENSKRGLNLPRVELQNINELYPMFASGDPAYINDEKKTHIGLTIYNIKDDPANRLCPGPYVWNGSKWLRLWGDCETNSILCNSSTLVQITGTSGSPISPVSHTLNLILVYDGINLPSGTIINQGGAAIKGLQVQTSAAVSATAPSTPTINVTISGTPTVPGIYGIPIEITLTNGEKLNCSINVEVTI